MCWSTFPPARQQSTPVDPVTNIKTSTVEPVDIDAQWHKDWQMASVHAPMASHLHICKKSAYRWRKFKDVLNSGRHRLDVSTCQEYRRRWVSAASPSTGPQCGTVCHQHCVTAACHWTRSRGGWRFICLDSHECHPAPLWHFVILAPDINVMTYLLTSVVNNFFSLRPYYPLLPGFNSSAVRQL